MANRKPHNHPRQYDRRPRCARLMKLARLRQDSAREAVRLREEFDQVLTNHPSMTRKEAQ